MRDGDVPGRVVDLELGGALDGRPDVVVGGAAGVVGLVRRRQGEGGRPGGHVQLQRRHHVQQRVGAGVGGLSAYVEIVEDVHSI